MATSAARARAYAALPAPLQKLLSDLEPSRGEAVGRLTDKRGRGGIARFS